VTEETPDKPVREADLDPVPKLPRGKMFRFVWADLFRIGFLLTMLVAVIANRDSCSQGVAKFIGAFEPPPDAAPAAPAIPPGYELLTPERVEELFPPALDAAPPK